LEIKDDVEAEISKDVTIFMFRFGGFRSESKLKWINYIGEFRKKGENKR
jgi:hypothetical protein